MNAVPLRDLSQQLHTLLEVEQNFEAGFALGRHILRYWPRHLDTYARLGPAAVTVGLYADAADLLRRALSADPEAGPLWAGLRQAASALGLSEEAELARQYEQDLLGLLPDARAVPAARVVKAGSAAHWSQALRYYRQAFSAQPGRMDAAAGLATALWHLERYEACLTIAEAVLRQLPYCLKAHLLVALCVSELGNPSKAGQYIKTARLIDPDDLYARRWFGERAPTAPVKPAMLPAWDKAERWSFAGAASVASEQ